MYRTPVWPPIFLLLLCLSSASEAGFLDRCGKLFIGLWGGRQNGGSTDTPVASRIREGATNTPADLSVGPTLAPAPLAVKLPGPPKPQELKEMATSRRELANVLRAIQRAPRAPMKDPPPELIIEDFERVLAMIRSVRDSLTDESSSQAALTALASEYRRLSSVPNRNPQPELAAEPLISYIESAPFLDPGERARFFAQMEEKVSAAYGEEQASLALSNVWARAAEALRSIDEAESGAGEKQINDLGRALTLGVAPTTHSNERAALAHGLDPALRREFGSVNYKSTGLQLYGWVLEDEAAVAQNTAQFLVELSANPANLDSAALKVWPLGPSKSSAAADGLGSLPPLNLSITATENGFATASPRFLLSAQSGELRAQAEGLVRNTKVPAARLQVVKSYLAVMDHFGLTLDRGDPKFMSLVTFLKRLYD
jgi:hypothetical protein